MLQPVTKDSGTALKVGEAVVRTMQIMAPMGATSRGNTKSTSTTKATQTTKVSTPQTQIAINKAVGAAAETQVAKQLQTAYGSSNVLS